MRSFTTKARARKFKRRRHMFKYSKPLKSLAVARRILHELRRQRKELTAFVTRQT